MSERAASVGFDWADESGSRAKVDEELEELREAVNSDDGAAVEHEIGDLFFALVNYARHLGIDPERALRMTNQRFRTRFNHVEAEVKRERGDWPREGSRATRGVPMEELEAHWQEAKRHEVAAEDRKR